MANRYAIATGVWSNPAIWDGGLGVPGVGDTVRPNGYIVTIDQDITVDLLTSNANAPASSGGYFQLTEAATPAPGITLTCDITRSAATGSAVQVLLINGAISKPITIVGDITHLDTSTSTYTIYQATITHEFPATFTITGNITHTPGSTSSTISCVFLAGIFSNIVVNGNIEVNGSLGSGFNRQRSSNSNATPQLMTINGDVILSGGSSGIALYMYATSAAQNMELVVNGNVINTGTSGGTAINSTMDGSSSHITINGDVIDSGFGSGSVILMGFTSFATGRKLSIYGDIICSNTASHPSYSVSSSHAGNVYVQGDITASANKIGLYALAARVMVEGDLISGPDGWMPMVVRNFRTPNSGRITWTFPVDDASWPLGGDTTPLVLSNYFDETPPPDDVRDGVTYGVGGSLEGTLAVPAPGSVALGVPTDDTEGTAVLLIDSGIATIDSTGAQIAAALTS